MLNNANYNERELIRKAQNGDPNAFNTLLGAHEQRMYAVACRMCKNEEDAKDCLMDAMMRVWRSISAFKGDSAFSTWVYRITVNTCLDELRRKKKKAETSIDDLLEVGWEVRDSSLTPEESEVLREKLAFLKKEIYQLPEDMHAAIILRDIQGFSYEEISNILDINVGTVKSRINRARSRLRKQILQHPEFFDIKNRSN